MDISKNSLVRFLLYLGIVIFSGKIYSSIYLHFMFILRNHIHCPALDTVSACELGINAGLVGAAVGYFLMSIIVLKWVELIKQYRSLNILESFLSFLGAMASFWCTLFFVVMSSDAGSTDDSRVSLFISYFLCTSLFFAINCVLSFLDYLAKERTYE